jgi:iron-sulfur cluster repair protein YtfE (RIC family)
MNTPATTPAAIEKLHQEHDALREKLAQIHDVFKGVTPAPEEINSLLHDFEEAVVVHFAREEEDGFFDQVVCHAPSLAGQADRLCVEHRQLRREAAELRRFASCGSASVPWWRELASRCHAFSQKLMQHESAENYLLQTAYRQDVGVVD